ncbi:MAG: 50S ribosomal protein L33 [Candidatus Spechtbacterales bacterium]
MSQDNLVKLECVKCKEINYFTTRNKKTVEKKLELKKFCKSCRAHHAHKESRKK